MRALLHLLLLVGVLVGLAGQGVALAAEPCPMELAQSADMAGMDCCPEQDRAHHHSVPCGEMTFACMAMAGCATLAALEANGAEGSIHSSGAPQFWQMATALRGRTIPPDTHPPAGLG